MRDDLLYGLRAMARNPAVTAVALLTLALGIGANTAMFSVINAVLLRPLPFRDPGRLMWIWAGNTTFKIPQAMTFYSRFAEWRDDSHSFESMAAYSPFSANLTSGAEPERVRGLRVDAAYFHTLGIAPALGRTFTADEDRPGAGHSVVLSYAMWQRRFGGERGVLGQKIVLDGDAYTVIGVLVPGAEIRVIDYDMDLYVPMARAVSRTDFTPVGVFARLKPGATIERAQAELNTIVARQNDREQYVKGWFATVWRMRDFMVRNVRVSLLVLAGAVALVLLIACANVANILLARAGAREREIAVRMAMGASRRRIVRQLLTESVLMSALGGALGVLLAWIAVTVVAKLGPASISQLSRARVDLGVLAFTAGIVLVTGLVFGTAPALAASRPDMYETLKEGGRSAADSRRRSRLRSALVAAEVAIALVLMVGASLLLGSLLRLQRANPGFNPEGVLTASVTLPQARYANPEQRVEFFRALMERVNAVPGVQAAGVTSSLPFGGVNSGQVLLAEGAPPPRPGEMPILYYRYVTPGYFRAMRVPLLRGRLLEDSDNGRVPVAVINETLAKRFWPDKDPIGKRFGNGRDWITVVGVVSDVKHMSLLKAPESEYYVPYQQGPQPDMVIAVRTASDPLRFAPALRGAVQEIDGDLPISQVALLTERIAKSIGSQRFAALLLGIFAAVALALAVVGIYGVMSYAVTRRTQEIGVRMALGADRAAVVRMVVGHAALVAGAGLAIGLAGGAALTRMIRSMLYETSATDPSVFAGVSAVLGVAALVAAYVPARRAARVDPTVALRHE